MRAVILAGGKGTRMRPLTNNMPKPLLPVGDIPVLELILRRLAAAGFDRAELSVGHMGDQIESHFASDGTVPDGMELTYHWEDEPLGTAGALKLIEPGAEPFLVMNGDIITDLDFGALMDFHQDQDAKVTIAATGKTTTLELGVIEHEGKRITEYLEKPEIKHSVSMGIYVCDPTVLEQVPDGRFDFPDLVKGLIRANEPVAVFEFAGTWFDIGTIEEYSRALAEAESNSELLTP